MTKPDPFFYRSMSLTEYQVHQLNARIAPGTEWTQKTLYTGFPLYALKQWVDSTRNEHGMHDLVIQVHGKPEEFRLKLYSDYFKRDSQHDRQPMLPERFINIKALDFTRAKIVYDPRALTSNPPILELERIIR